jgi:ribosomal protein S7
MAFPFSLTRTTQLPIQTLHQAFEPIDFNNPINSNFIGVGTVQKPVGLHQRGRITINGQWWTALTTQSQLIQVGEVIRVIGRKELTLFVQSSQHG